MRFKSPLIAISAAGVLALSACGGSGSNSDAGQQNDQNKNLGNTGNGKDATAKGPVTIDGATKGGTVTVLSLGGGGLSLTIDPSEIYYTDSASIFSGLIGRSLTQYKYDPKTGQMVLVPDLATDLGTSNDTYTKWSFTIRPGVKWAENGKEVTAKEVAWGMTRCMDTATFPNGACPYYSDVYYKGGSSYKGPYTSKQNPGTIFKAINVHGNTITISMDKPFPDMPYWGAFPENGPVPLDAKISDPVNYKKKPWSTGPYMIKSFSLGKELDLVRNPNWDASTDPARTQYPDGYNIKLQTPTAKIDQIMLADTGTGQTSLTYDDLLAPDYTQLKQKDPSRLTLGGQPCTFYYAPDGRTIKDIRVRKAIAWAFPYKNYVLAGGYIPGVTRIPATNLMPPGLPGRTPYNVLGRKGYQSDPAKSKELLKQANASGFELKFFFSTDSPSSVKIKDALVKGFTEGGFKATPVPTTSANLAADLNDVNKDVNLRSAGWCSDWPSGSTWLPTVLGDSHINKSHSFGVNYSTFHNKASEQQMDAIQKLPLDQQPDAWNALDKQIFTKFYPLVTTFYGGVAQAHGSKINGDNDDNTFGMPTWKNIWVSK